MKARDSNQLGRRGTGRRRWVAPFWRRTVLVAAAVVLAGLAAACGARSGPGVASVGASSSVSSKTSTSQAGAPALTSVPSLTLQKDQLAYTKCMRAHGVSNFPDPGSGGGYPGDYMRQIDATSPQFLIDTKDCRPLAGAAGMAPWTQSQWAAYDTMLLKISTCMHAHGIANFPDPKGGDKGGFGQPSGPIDSSSPQYVAAAKACHGPPAI